MSELSGGISRRTFVQGVGAVLAAARAGAQSGDGLVGGWCGAITPSGATIKICTRTADTPVVLSVAPAVAGASQTEHRQSADANGVATFVLSGLSPLTRYGYESAIEGAAPFRGAFRTFADGPQSFRVAFASCARTGSTSRVFTDIAALAPDLFIHTGDLHYANITRNDVGRYRNALHRVLASPAQAALFRQVPLAYTWDDHDYGDNNADARSPSRLAALEAYRAFVPHYPLGPSTAPHIYQAFTIGRVRFLLTDTRSARSADDLPDAERTMLGAEQLAWFERELSDAAAAPLVVWVNTVPWITKEKESTNDGWARYHVERRRLADQIVRLGLTRRLVMLSGDAHMVALDDGTHSQYSTLPEAPSRGFVVAHAAPLDQRTTRKGGPYSGGVSRENGQFGVMEVVDTGDRVAVTLEGRRYDQPLPGMRLELSPQ